MFTFRQDVNRRLDDVRDRADRAAGLIDAHIKQCEEHEKASTAWRASTSDSIDQLHDQLRALGRWIVSMVVTIGGAVIVGLVTALAWMIQHYALHGG